jgi:hypothetical protein
MPQDTRLDRRIAAAMPVITNIAQPRDELIAQCQKRAEIAIRTIAGWDGWPLTRGAKRKGYLEALADGWPEITVGRPGAQRKSYLDAAGKIRETLATIHPVFFLNHKADAVERFAQDLEEAASEIPDRHGGGPDQTLIDKWRKLKTAEYARSLLTTFGTIPDRPRTRATQLKNLAQVLYKAATGRSSDLRRAVGAMRRQP